MQSRRLSATSPILNKILFVESATHNQIIRYVVDTHYFSHNKLMEKSVPLIKRDTFRLAVKNIAKFGDTDIFPYPIENHIFNDKADGVIAVLESIDKDFDAAVKVSPS